MIRSISWKHNQMGKAKKMTERPFAGLTIIWKAFNTILWPIMVAITSMFFACKQTPKIETLESTQRFKSLSELKIPLCVSCRSTKEVQAFEDSLGSRRIDLVLGHIAKAFNQTAFEAADTLKNYTSEYGGYANFSNQYDYEIYIRKQTNDSIPHVAIVYEFSRYPPYEFPEGQLGLNLTIAKLFFEDPILDPHLLDTNYPKFSPDSNFVWALFDTVYTRLQAYYPANSLEPRRPWPIWNDYFIIKGDIFNKDRFRFAETEDDNGDFYAGAPFEEHYVCEYMSTKFDDKANPLFPDAPRIDYCLGWASSYGHYSHVDTVNQKLHHRLKIEAKDLAIYITFNIFNQ
jgi:hypothetical protein